MNLLFSCIGKRGYIAELFREVLEPSDRIIATSNTPWTPGFAACDRGVLMPDISAEEYLPAVLDLCREEQIDAILSFFDPDVLRLTEFHDCFRDLGVTPIFPKHETARICFDKYETFRFLRDHGLPTPNTFVDLNDVHKAILRAEISYPLVVKPRTGFGSAHTYFARNERELDAFFAAGPPMIVQPKAIGEDLNFDICHDLYGNAVELVLWRKLRSTLGETEQVVTYRDEQLLAFGAELGNTVRSIGPMDVDMIVDQQGRPTIIELNPRFGGGYPVSHLAGANFPELIVRMIRGETIQPNLGEYQDGVVMMKLLTVVGGPAQEFWSSTLHIDQGKCPDVTI